MRAQATETNVELIGVKEEENKRKKEIKAQEEGQERRSSKS